VVRWDVPTAEDDEALEIDFRDAQKAIVLGEQFAGDLKAFLASRIGGRRAEVLVE
jgi:hypothetical protein